MIIYFQCQYLCFVDYKCPVTTFRFSDWVLLCIINELLKEHSTFSCISIYLLNHPVTLHQFTSLLVGLHLIVKITFTVEITFVSSGITQGLRWVQSQRPQEKKPFLKECKRSFSLFCPILIFILL